MPKLSEERKEERKEIILQAALDCFSEKGYAISTIDSIAQRCGISKGGIYVHFRSKEEIFQAIALRATAQRHGILENQNKRESAEKKLKGYLQEALGAYLVHENFKRIRFSFEFWLSNRMRGDQKGNDLSEFNNKRFRETRGDVLVLIEEGVRSGEFRADTSVDSIAYIILAAIDGMAFFTAVLDQKLTPDIVRDFSDLIVKSIKK